MILGHGCGGISRKSMNLVALLCLIKFSNLDSKDLLQLILFHPGVQVQHLLMMITITLTLIITVNIVTHLLVHALDDRPDGLVHLVAHQVAHYRPLAGVSPLQAECWKVIECVCWNILD